MMSEQNKVEALVTELEAANEAVLAFVEQCTAGQWQMIVASEERPVGTVCHHIAFGYRPVVEWAMTVAAGSELPPITLDVIHQANARHSDKHQTPTQAETAAALRENCATAVARLRQLNDAQLSVKAPFALLGGKEIDAARIMQRFAISHAQNHLKEIQETIGSET
jgi:hypothetical protein